MYKRQGLGGSLAIEAAKHGAQVVLHYNSSVKSAQKVLEQVRAYGCLLYTSCWSRICQDNEGSGVE